MGLVCPGKLASGVTNTFSFQVGLGVAPAEGFNVAAEILTTQALLDTRCPLAGQDFFWKSNVHFCHPPY